MFVFTNTKQFWLVLRLRSDRSAKLLRWTNFYDTALKSFLYGWLFTFVPLCPSIVRWFYNEKRLSRWSAFCARNEAEIVLRISSTLPRVRKTKRIEEKEFHERRSSLLFGSVAHIQGGKWIRTTGTPSVGLSSPPHEGKRKRKKRKKLVEASRGYNLKHTFNDASCTTALASPGRCNRSTKVHHSTVKNKTACKPIWQRASEFEDAQAMKVMKHYYFFRITRRIRAKLQSNFDQLPTSIWWIFFLNTNTFYGQWKFIFIFYLSKNDVRFFWRLTHVGNSREKMSLHWTL